MSKIVIGIACHKPFEMPRNDLYLPINVGAALREKPLAGMQPDDEGEGISEKNPRYCELTAQYWLWKNVEADYYGLCHYRRFLSFAPGRFENYTPDNRRQVLVPELNAASKMKYHLEDEEGMRAIIESADIVAPEEQDLRKVYTPHGHKRSVYKHFAAHDHDLINVHDLDEMISIVHERYPHYAADMDEYLSGPEFRGFNCFVMRRDLFFELCEYEFDVLAELERRIDFESYDVMRARVYGFMAEIMSSAFIYHVAKRRAANVRDVQMLYFASTDPVVDIPASEGASTVVLDALGAEPSVFAVTLQSLLGSLDVSRRYDLVVVHGERFSAFYRKRFADVVEPYSHVCLSFVDWTVKSRALADSAGCDGNMLASSLHCLLPWILPRHDRMVVFEWNVLFRGDWSSLLSLDLNGNVAAAAYDVEWIGFCNGVYGDDRQFVREFLGLSDPLACSSSAVVVLDAKAIRSALDFKDVACVLGSFERPLGSNEAFNVVYEHSIERVDLRFNVRMSTEPDFAWYIGDLPLEIAGDYKRACQDPVIVSYVADDPFWGEADHVVEFWTIARRSPFYEQLVMHAVSVHVAAGKQGRNAMSLKRRLYNGIAPEGSRRRAVIRKAIPWNSPVSRKIRTLVAKL